MKHVTLAATARRCGPVASDATPDQAQQAAAAYLAQVIDSVSYQKPDLLLLPELCDWPEGMPMEAYLANAQNGNAALAFARQAAQEHKMWIAFPTVYKGENGKLRNSCLLLNRQGETECVYSKIHLTQGERQAGLEPGTEPVAHRCELGNVGFAICFDLNYTDLAQRYRELGTNLLLFPSLFHGGLLQSIWAFSARSWLLGSCGGLEATVVMPTGEYAARSTEYYTELTHTVNLDYALLHLDFNKPKLERALRRYQDKIKVHDPGRMASVLLMSESDSVPISQLVREYALETLDTYLARFS